MRRPDGTRRIEPRLGLAPTPDAGWAGEMVALLRACLPAIDTRAGAERTANALLPSAARTEWSDRARLARELLRQAGALPGE